MTIAGEQEILLSCLIPTIPGRSKMRESMLAMLEEQTYRLPLMDGKAIEVLCLYDNFRRTVGEKRNSLLREAKGLFIVFFDDDDMIEGDYLYTVLQKIKDNRDVDCIVYDQICTRPKMEPQYCRYGLELEYNHAIVGNWTGKPAHTMPWRRELVQETLFRNKDYGEDIDWVKTVAKRAKKQARIERVMYYYRFDPTVSRTRHGIV